MDKIKNFLASDGGKAVVAGMTLLYFATAMYAQRQRIKVSELELQKLKEDV